MAIYTYEHLTDLLNEQYELVRPSLKWIAAKKHEKQN